MNICDEDTAKYVAESLLEHARSVYKYTNNYCRNDEFNARFDDKTRATFKRHADSLLEDLYAMLLLTRYNGVDRFCNAEQIEAYYEAGREILDGPREGCESGDVVDYFGLLN